ncbi:Gfo/Idh/MocA family oxidoreductase, partial [Acinetobacter baumannii]
NEQVLTYVKAISLNNEMQLTLFDINEILAKEIAKKYTCSVAKDIKISSLEQYDMISICTPTSTHCEILQNAIIANPRLIICEKP